MTKVTSCEGCCACCKLMLIRFSGVMPANYARARGIRIIGNFMAFENVCPQLKEGKCSIYPDRPRTCAAFPIGGIDCALCRKIKAAEGNVHKSPDKENLPL